jgi:hypothetical protein
MTIENIIDNQGATLTKTLRKSSLKSGYMVSLKGYEIIIKASQETRLFYEIGRANTRAEVLNNSYVGVWIENGLAYIDVSINIKELNKAITFGKDNEQLAIYDIKNNEVITL